LTAYLPAFQRGPFECYSKPQIQSQQGRPGRASVSLSPTFFIAKTQQQRFKLIKCLLLIGP
jgi:hypothetical protein